MKVLLKEDVSNLGYAGEVMDVADGYGRNYLIPQGMAIKATPGVLAGAKAWRERAKIRLAEVRKEHEVLSNRISGTKLVFRAKAGESGKLYGSITTNDIVDQLNKVLGTSVDRRNVIGEPLRQLGEHHVTVRLSRDYQPQVVVNIHPEGGLVEEEEISIEDEIMVEETFESEDAFESEEEFDEFAETEAETTELEA